jgi:hypothetical protein
LDLENTSGHNLSAVMAALCVFVTVVDEDEGVYKEVGIRCFSTVSDPSSFSTQVC